MTSIGLERSCIDLSPCLELLVFQFFGVLTSVITPFDRISSEHLCGGYCHALL